MGFVCERPWVGICPVTFGTFLLLLQKVKSHIDYNFFSKCSGQWSQVVGPIVLEVSETLYVAPF